MLIFSYRYHNGMKNCVLYISNERCVTCCRARMLNVIIMRTLAVWSCSSISAERWILVSWYRSNLLSTRGRCYKKVVMSFAYCHQVLKSSCEISRPKFCNEKNRTRHEKGVSNEGKNSKKSWIKSKQWISMLSSFLIPISSRTFSFKKTSVHKTPISVYIFFREIWDFLHPIAPTSSRFWCVLDQRQRCLRRS